MIDLILRYAEAVHRTQAKQAGQEPSLLESFHTTKESFMKWVSLRVLLILLTSISGYFEAIGQDEIFSGPQVGERLSPFTVRGVFDQEAGKDFDLVSKAEGKPIVLIFVHDVNRQSVSLTRILSDYTKSRDKDGVISGVVFLDDDATAAESQLNRMRHALTPGIPTGVSIDGREGPGNYGLNRNVTLTILVGKDNQVTGNFALVQPSLQVDLPKILNSIVAVAGGPVPKLEDLPGMRENLMRDQPTDSEVLNLRPLLVPLIRRDASEEQVDQAAWAVEDRAAKDEAVRREVGRIANTIVDAGKLENYGTKKAQEYLTRWAKEYGKASPDITEEKPKSRSEPERER